MAAMKLTDEQRKAVETLSNAPEHAHESKLAVFRQLPLKAKPAYFREHFLVPLVAALAIIALVAFLVVRFVTPDNRPKLYAAVLDGAIDTSEAQTMQQHFADKLGQDVTIDSYFDTSKDGLSKLQTMLSAKQIDVIIAPRAMFQQLAGYGYLTDLKSSLSETQQSELASSMVSFNGFSDAESDDPGASGDGKGASKPYGLKLNEAKGWSAFASDDSDALIGIAADTQQTDTAREFINWLYQ
ncbi:hypothetical protein [Bifidobacterium panos]|uniref:ABC transporter substrate-binding protein n=1 Tax=Bifidobacterium panos TaxID=2675321 RepID=A0ABX1SX27_9BIFI|nr:hypothetical protein [Bifidobacterium sp. DSM 109963]NMN02403.1 hypothetical protein [Bifidobacterium sp. DSM 109963]